MSKLVAGCTFVEGSRTFEVGKEVDKSYISEERLELLKRLPGWGGKTMVYEVDGPSNKSTASKAPENKVSEPEEIKVPKQESAADEDDELLQKATMKNLKKLAKELKVKGYTQMERDELIAAIKEAEVEEDEDDDEE